MTVCVPGRRTHKDQSYSATHGRDSVCRNVLLVLRTCCDSHHCTVDQYPRMVAASKADLVGFLIGDLLHSDGLKDRLHSNPNKVVDQGVHWLISATVALSNQHLLAAHSHHHYHAVTLSGGLCKTCTGNQTLLSINPNFMHFAEPKSAAC